VFETLVELSSSGVLMKHTLVSLRRVASGDLLAIGLAVPVALLFSLSRTLRRAIEPLLEFLRQIPPLAMMPLLILWLGIGETQKIGIIVLFCFFPILLGIRSWRISSMNRPICAWQTLMLTKELAGRSLAIAGNCAPIGAAPHS
jgi:ABC-type nitrate/sulfonate/bicarbonate transport system permease component